MKRIRFELRQWRLRKIIRNEEITRRTMKYLDLDYDDVNLRYIRKIEHDEMFDFIIEKGIN